MGAIEAYIVQGLVGALVVVTGTAVTYAGKVLLPRAKRLVDAHVSVKQAEYANKVLDGLYTIMVGVVHNFNKSVVAEAKAHGQFTKELAESVRQDAIAAIKSQAGYAIGLNDNVTEALHDVIDNMITAYVEAHHIQGIPPIQTLAPQTPTVPEASVIS